MTQGVQALAGHISALLDHDAISLAEAAAIMAKFVQGQLGCSWVSIWVFAPSERGRVMRHLAGYDAVTPATVTKWPELAESECPAYFGALRSQGAYVCNDCLADERLAPMRERYLIPHAIRASMDATIGFNGTARGVIRCGQRGATREWTPQDITLIKRVAAEISMRRARRAGRAVTDI
jgi:GAF domain-containing protein